MRLLGWPAMIIYWIVGLILSLAGLRLLLRLYDKKLQRTDRERLVADVRREFAFLFMAYGGAVVANTKPMPPDAFDYVTVTVLCHGLLVRVVRGRGDTQVDLARSRKPDLWIDIITLISAVRGDSERPARRWVSDLGEAASLLAANFERIANGLTDNDGRVDDRLEAFFAADRASVRG